MDTAPTRRRTRLRTLAPLLGAAALVGALVLTGARILQPRNYLMTLLATVSPLAVVAGLLAAALLVGRARRTGRGRAPAAVGVLLAVAVAATHLWWLAPAFTGGRPAAAPGPGLTVLTQNFEYGDVEDLWSEVRSAGADVVVLVDVQPGQFDRLEASGFLSSFPHRSGVDSPSPSNTILLSRYPYTSQQVLTEDYDSRLFVLEGTPLGTLALAAVHPPPPYADGSRPWSRHLRTIGDALARQARDRPSVPVLAVGDFNADTPHQPFRRLLGVAGLRDAAEMANTGWAPTFPANGHWTSHGVAPPPFTAIDHVLVGRALTVTAVDRVDISDSDHLGLVARVALREGARPG